MLHFTHQPFSDGRKFSIQPTWLYPMCVSHSIQLKTGIVQEGVCMLHYIHINHAVSRTYFRLPEGEDVYGDYFTEV